MSNSSIMSIRDMIDTAFLDPEINVVNFKLVQSILYLLARQLRILGRQVEVDLSPALKVMSPKTSLSVTEVKLTAQGSKKRKSGGLKSDKSSSDKVTSDGRSTVTIAKAAPSDVGSSKDKGAKITRSPGQLSGELSSAAKNKGGKVTEQASGVADVGESTKPSKKMKKKDGLVLPAEAEEDREVLLRIIDQRADSHEEPDRDPLPMASVTDIRQESLLIIQRVPSRRASSTARVRSASQSRTTRLSIVTQDEFAELEEAVRQLQAKFAFPGIPNFPGNAELMEKLLQGASLTDAMSALQLSARLEAAEKMLNRLIDIVTEVAANTGVDISAVGINTDVQHPMYGKIQPGEATGPSSQTPRAPSRHAKAFAQPPPPTLAPTITPSTFLKGVKDTESEDSVEMTLPASSGTGVEQANIVKPVWVTFEEFEAAMKELRNDIMQKATSFSQRNTSTAEAAMKNARRLELKLEEAMNFGSRMADLEAEVSDYSEQINAMDTGLSSQMTKYQEQLTQMQHELETGLENMAEALVNVGGDPIAVAEMNARLTSLQNDLEYTTSIQKELREKQNRFSMDLQEIHKTIEMLRETKADREEVEDAFRDKAGLGALNGLVTREQYDAVRGDLEKRIRIAYDKFNSQEIVWQKAIDDFVREMNEKVDQVHVVALRDEINNNMNMLRSRINALAEIVGEPRAFALAKKINREAACLSCATPANMSLEVPRYEAATPSSPGPRAKGGVAAEPEESGDYSRPCYPGQPIPHARDPRSHYCNRYCGGSHTRLPSAGPTRLPPDITVKHCERPVLTGVGTDGKSYMIDDRRPVPCAPCNQPSGDFVSRPEVPNPMPEGAKTGSIEASFSQAPGEMDTLIDLELLPRTSADDASTTPPFTADS